MSEVSIRELRNRGGDVVERAANGERVTITRAGRPVAELRPLQADPKSLDLIMGNRRNLPAVDPSRLRDDLDDAVEPGL